MLAREHFGGTPIEGLFGPNNVTHFFFINILDEKTMLHLIPFDGKENTLEKLRLKG